MYSFENNFQRAVGIGFISFIAISTSLFADDQESKDQPQAHSVIEAVEQGRPQLDFRFRHEHTSTNAANIQKGRSNTLRTRMSFETMPYWDSQLKLELIHVAAYINNRYNPNVEGMRKNQYSSVHDVKGTGLSQAYISYQGLEATDIRLGRQFINLDNERFVGSDQFRQFPQSYDAITVTNKLLEDLEIFYALVTHVNDPTSNSRSVGRSNVRTHLMNVGWTGLGYGKISGYNYMHNDKTNNTNSNVTWGIRFNGDTAFQEDFNLYNTFEFAQARGRYNHPTRFRARYWLFELGTTFSMLKGKVGFESMQGHSSVANKAFQTPLASKHDFNGMADVFTTIPNRGLRDYYGMLGGNLYTFDAGVEYHYFKFESGATNVRLGHEWDLFAEKEINKYFSARATYAKFTPKLNTGYASRKRIWVSANLKFG